jgi:hypothetical protein
MKPKVDLSNNASKRQGPLDSLLEGDISNDTNSDITQDISDTNDITIEVNNDYETAKSTIILRLKPSTVNALDEIAYKARKSRNYIAQKLLDQAISKVKIKTKE